MELHNGDEVDLIQHRVLFKMLIAERYRLLCSILCMWIDSLRAGSVASVMGSFLRKMRK